MPFNSLANDTKRQFILTLNAKSCYFFQTQQRQLFPLECLKTRHRIITLTEYEIWKILPDRSGSVTWFYHAKVDYRQFNSKGESNGIYEVWCSNVERRPGHRVYNYCNGKLLFFTGHAIRPPS
jgi:hypothetical protein